jgi:DNA mismatch endonuclease Vsr
MAFKPTSYSDYVRDNRSPIPLNETVSKYMRSNKSKNTKPEILFRKALWKAGIRGYRLHWKKAPGKPDIAFPSKKIAIFLTDVFGTAALIATFHYQRITRSSGNRSLNET